MTEEPPSPCTGVCRIDDRIKVCTGCLRALDEIAAWSSLSTTAKRDLIGRLQAREIRFRPA